MAFLHELLLLRVRPESAFINPTTGGIVDLVAFGCMVKWRNDCGSKAERFKQICLWG